MYLCGSQALPPAGRHCVSTHEEANKGRGKTLESAQQRSFCATSVSVCYNKKDSLSQQTNQIITVESGCQKVSGTQACCCCYFLPLKQFFFFYTGCAKDSRPLRQPPPTHSHTPADCTGSCFCVGLVTEPEHYTTPCVFINTSVLVSAFEHVIFALFYCILLNITSFSS